MAGRKPLLAEVPKAPDAAPTLMDEAQFRKLEEERDRPRSGGTNLFGPQGPEHGRSGARPQPARPSRRRRPQHRLGPPLERPVAGHAGCRLVDRQRAVPAVVHGTGSGCVRHPADPRSDGIAGKNTSAHRRHVADPRLRQDAGRGQPCAVSVAPPGSRTLLMDMELRRPQLAEVLGLHETAPLRDVLLGRKPFRSHILRAGGTLALALNGGPNRRRLRSLWQTRRRKRCQPSPMPLNPRW